MSTGSRSWQRERAEVFAELKGLQRLVQDLNALYRTAPALHQVDFEPAGFRWIDCNDWEGSAISFLRRARNPEDLLPTAGPM